jgi:hypothetical protein
LLSINHDYSRFFIELRLGFRWLVFFLGLSLGFLLGCNLCQGLFLVRLPFTILFKRGEDSLVEDLMLKVADEALHLVFQVFLLDYVNRLVLILIVFHETIKDHVRVNLVGAAPFFSVREIIFVILIDAMIVNNIRPVL